jgi:hypothetical protein
MECEPIGKKYLFRSQAAVRGWCDINDGVIIFALDAAVVIMDSHNGAHFAFGHIYFYKSYASFPMAETHE